MSTINPPIAAPTEPEALFEALPRIHKELKAQIAKRIVGQEKVVEDMLIALFSGGHCLFIGVPGLAKTLLVNTVADVMGLEFGRIQFTPDLMPSDITGGEVLEEDKSTGERHLRFVKGPVFVNLLLADEINRTPPKTQAALLQAMQEAQVTAGGVSYDLAPPFLVFATQNPIEQEGTYPLPEAQLDRFMFSIQVHYPTEAEEVEIISRTTSGVDISVENVLDIDTLLRAQTLLRQVVVPEDVNRYAARLARATRPGEDALEYVKKYVQWGAGPRASQYLSIGARVRAGLSGRPNADFNDVRDVARCVLSHRIVRNFQAEAEGIQPEAIVNHILQTVK